MRVESVRRNAGTGFSLFVGTPGEDHLYRGPTDSSTYGYRTRTLCRGVGRRPSARGPTDSFTHGYEDQSHCRGTRVGVTLSGV